MINTIRFLETIGASPISYADYAGSVAALDVDPAEREALLQHDHAALNDLLRGRQTMFLAVFAPDEEPCPEDDPAEDEPAEDEPVGIPSDPDTPD